MKINSILYIMAILVIIIAAITGISYIHFNYKEEKENKIYIISNDEKGNISVIDENGTSIFYGTNISNILTRIDNIIEDNEKNIIKIKEGVYNPPSTVIFTKSIKLEAEGNVVFNWNKSEDQFLFVFTGKEIGNSSIESDIKENSNIIMANLENISNIDKNNIDKDNIDKGNLILISDNATWNPNFYPGWKTGELHEISSKSGNIITISDKTINSFAINRSGDIKLIKPITVQINGISLNGPGDKLLCRGILLKYNKNSLIHNSKLQRCGKDEIVVEDSYKVSIENNIIGDNIYNGLGYGVVIADSTAYTNITSNFFYNCRHCVTIGGSGIMGQGRETTVNFNMFNDITGTQAVIDAHPISESYYIYYNIIYSPSLEGAIVTGSRKTKIIGNIIIGGLGIYLYNTTKSDFSLEINDNYMIDSRRIFNNENSLQISRIDIKNNTIIGDIWSIAALYNATSFNISGNIFNSKNNKEGQWGIYIKNSKNGKIFKNNISNSYYSGIMLESTNNTIISRNNLENYNNYGDLGESGIKLDNSSYNSIIGNILNKFGKGAYGISEIGTSDHNEISNNDLVKVGDITDNRIQSIGKNTNISNNKGYK